MVAYTGRWAEKDPPEGVERYMLPPEFHKNFVLYNLHRVAGTEHVVLVESYWSVFRLHALGIKAVGLMGRSISSVHVSLLEHAGVRAVTLLLDGDEPGRTATADILPTLARHFFVHAAELPVGRSRTRSRSVSSAYTS